MKHYSTLLALSACLFSAAVSAQDVGLAGIMGSKAMLILNGGEPQSVAIGQALDGVKVVSIQGDQVIIEIAGKKRPLRVGQHAIGTVSSDAAGKVVMAADSRGHFYTNGRINGTSVRFLVDTGATMVSLGAADARRMGLDFNSGQKGVSQTANGQTMVSKIQLDTVQVGDVTMHNVEALIHQTDLPIALLGMSFLNRMDMQRDGNTMTLKKRF